MNIKELESEMVLAYNNLLNATANYRKQAEKVRSLERALELDILDAYANDMIEGKNQTQRDAAEYKMFRSRMHVIENEKHEEAETYREKEIAEIEVKYLHDILRIKELSEIEQVQIEL
jgi:hypothetical protein